jgi:hypothetical protein
MSNILICIDILYLIVCFINYICINSNVTNSIFLERKLLKMTKSQLQELLVKLFLRLNGYFTSGLIIHSDEKGKNKTEIDLLAVRFPHHNQTDRMIDCLDYLKIPDNSIDIIIGEVKGSRLKVSFNKALYSDIQTIKKVINWIGVIPEKRVHEITNKLQIILKPSEANNSEKFKVLNYSFDSYLITIRPILFCIDRGNPKINQQRYVYGKIMLDYIWDCLSPKALRNTCSTSYPTNLWGFEFQELVNYFKNSSKESVGSIKELYKHFKL